MLDMIAFLGARGGTVAPLNVAGLADSHCSVIGNNIIVPTQCNKILMVGAISQATAGSLTNIIQLSSPSLRATSLLDITNHCANGAVVAAAQIFDNDAPVEIYKESPIELQPGESLQCLSAVDAAAVAENIIVPIVLTDGVLACPFTGRIESVIFDYQAAAVINVFSPSALVPRQALRAGTYAVVGMKDTGTSHVAARLIFGNQGARPGVFSCNSAVGAAGVGSFSDAKDQANGLFRYGRLGVWGTFSHINNPVIEVIASVADAAIAQHVVLDLIKIA